MSPFSVAASCLAAGWGLVAAETFEVQGEIHPPASASVTLHAVASPFSTSVLCGPSGRFRFRKVEPGAYTLSVFLPRRGETRQTIDVGPGTSDARRRVNVRVNIESTNFNRESAATVSASELTIPAAARREFEEAARNIAARKTDDAIAHLERAVEIAPRFAAAWNHLGTIAYQTRRYADAERYFRSGIDADPEAYEPVVNLGGVLLNLGNPDEAWEYNVEAVLRRPNDALAHAQLGMTYLALDKLDLAEKHLLEGRKLDASHFSHPQLHLAEVYYRKRDYKRAADQLEDLLRHHPDWPEAAKMRDAISRLRAQ